MKDVALRRVFRIVNGGTPSADVRNWDGNVPWATPVDLARANGGVLDATYRTLTRAGLMSGSASVPAGSLILSTRAPIGYIVGVRARTAFNQGCRGLVPRQDMEARFFRYQLSVMAQRLEGLGSGSTFPELATEALASVRLAVPELRDQRAIADFLDAETARIDALIANRRRMSELSEERLRARVDSALVGSSAESVRLKRLARRPLSYGANEVAEFENPDWPRYIRTTDMAPDGTLREATFRTLPPNVAQPFMLDHEDLLFTRSGATVGKSFIYDAAWGPACHAGYLISVRLDRRLVLPRFVHYWARSTPYWGQVSAVSVQATIQNVNAERYGDFVLPLPTITEQRRIVALLDQEHATARKLQSRLRSQVALLGEHRQALITAAVTGEIDVSNGAA